MPKIFFNKEFDFDMNIPWVFHSISNSFDKMEIISNLSDIGKSKMVEAQLTCIDTSDSKTLYLDPESYLNNDRLLENISRSKSISQIRFWNGTNQQLGVWIDKSLEHYLLKGNELLILEPDDSNSYEYWVGVYSLGTILGVVYSTFIQLNIKYWELTDWGGWVPYKKPINRIIYENIRAFVGLDEF